MLGFTRYSNNNFFHFELLFALQSSQEKHSSINLKVDKKAIDISFEEYEN